jgi:hypothetical protein
MPKKSLKVDRKQFEGIVKNLIQSAPLKRGDVKVSKKKPQRLIPPQKVENGTTSDRDGPRNRA